MRSRSWIQPKHTARYATKRISRINVGRSSQFRSARLVVEGMFDLDVTGGMDIQHVAQSVHRHFQNPTLASGLGEDRLLEKLVCSLRNGRVCWCDDADQDRAPVACDFDETHSISRKHLRIAGECLVAGQRDQSLIAGLAQELQLRKA